MRRSAFRWAEAGWFLVAAAVVYCVFRVGVRPEMVAEAHRLEEEVERLHASTNAAAMAPSGPDAEAAGELRSELTRVEERVAALRGILATSGESELVLQSLAATAAAAGVRFLRFAPEPGYQLDEYLASAVSVVAEGTFVDFLRFFERVSLSPHLVLVEEMLLERVPGDLLQCRFVAITVRAEGAAPGSRSAPDLVSPGSDPEGPAPGTAKT